MEELSELQKDIICDKIYTLTNGMSDDEIKYAIKIMNFWLDERERQDEELKELYGEDE